MTKEGDYVKIMTLDEEFEGTLLPEENDFVVLKLDSGYNIGISKKRIKKTQKLPDKKKVVTKKSSTKQNTKLPKVSVLHTGGTIASKVEYETCGVIARFDPEELIALFPELKELCTVRSRLVSQISSEDIQFGHYNILAQAVADD